MYIYDLGLKPFEIKSLSDFPFVHILPLNMTKPYFPNGACAFKPIMILDFIDRYRSRHNCRLFFYGDASVRLTKRFDESAILELSRLGIVAQRPLEQTQLAYT